MAQRRHWDLTISNSVVLIVFLINNILKLSYFPLNIQCIVELPLTSTSIQGTTLGKIMATISVSAGGPCIHSYNGHRPCLSIKDKSPYITALPLLMATSLPWPLSSVPKATSFPLSPCSQEQGKRETLRKRLSPRCVFSWCCGEVQLTALFTQLLSAISNSCYCKLFSWISLRGF